MTDLDAAAQFIAGHARLLERRRFARLDGDGSGEAVLTALRAYRNDDGGIGHLEPDLRTPASQPSCVLYALEIVEEAGTPDGALTTGALDWVRDRATNPDGGVPFVLPTAKGWPHAPWFNPPDEPRSSLLMTSGLVAKARRLGLDHRWLEGASAFCWAGLDAIADAPAPDPYTMRYLVDFLDVAPDRARADAALAVLATHVPADGVLRVGSGVDGETLNALDLAPRPDHAGRRLFADDVIERALDALAAGQADDGGWTFSWSAWNPAAALEWRGVVTVEALRTLAAYGRLSLPRR